MDPEFRRTRPNPIWDQAMRTEIGRPSSSMRLSAWTATSTSVARRSSLRERTLRRHSTCCARGTLVGSARPRSPVSSARWRPRRERASCSPIASATLRGPSTRCRARNLRPLRPCGRARRCTGDGGRAASARSRPSRSAPPWTAVARPRPRPDGAGRRCRRCCLGRRITHVDAPVSLRGCRSASGRSARP